MWLLIWKLRTKGRGRPSSKELSKYMKDVALKWKDVGIQLLSSGNILDIIEKCHHNVSKLYVATVTCIGE